jgi:2-oxoglutarate ferredoxin oxidoreductase subunit delta
MKLGNQVSIDKTMCKGCALCTTACPRKLLKLDTDQINGKGYHPSAMTAQELCISCAMCAIICPESAITVGYGEG